MSMKSLVKRLGAAALCVLLCVLSVAAVAAANNEVVIMECDGMKLQLPDNMTAVTRDTDKNDPYFAREGNDYNTVMRDFEEKNIYMRATDNIAVILTLTSNTTPQSKEMDNYNKYSFAQLEEIKNNTLSASGGAAVYTSGTPDEAGKDVVWIYYDLNAEGHSQYRAETIYGGKIITMTLFRNGGNVEPQDYQILSSVASSVRFAPKSDADNKKQMLIYIAIGAGVVALILLIVLIVVISKVKNRRKKTDNDKILQELAGKYQSNTPVRQVPEEPAMTGEAPVQTAVTAPKQEPAPQPAEEASDALVDSDMFDDEEYTGRKYSDADIARLLGDVEDDENFIEALSAEEAAPDDTEDMDSVTDTADDSISEFFEDAPEASEKEPTEEAIPDAAEAAPEAEEVTEAAEAVLATAGTVIKAEEADEAVEEAAAAEEVPAAAEEIFEETAEETDDETAEEISEEPKAETPEEAADEAAEAAAEASAEEAAAEEAAEESAEESVEEDEDFDEFVSDEVLAREENKQEKFKESSDFFEESPKKVMGVISSKEIEEAEEYDVIGEVEQRAGELEQEPRQKGEGFVGVLKKIGGGIKYFFVHCGYFATNVHRAFKRRRAMKKRKKAEEERRARQAERRRQERASDLRPRDKNGLVQVHRRDDRRPPNRR